jgi:hypothetical protein
LATELALVRSNFFTKNNLNALAGILKGYPIINFFWQGPGAADVELLPLKQ